MEDSPRYSFIDILWAPARALSAKQIFCMTFFLLLAGTVYVTFSYLAFWADNQSLSSVFSVYGFFTFGQLPLISAAGRAVWFTGAALGTLVMMFGFFSVAAINIESIRGNRFLSTRQAIRFTISRIPQIVRAELAITLFVGFVIFLFFLLGLLTRIPILGEWIFTLFLVIPNFIISMLSVFTVFVFSLTVVVLPAAAAADRRGESFSAVLETFSTIMRQPTRWVAYTAYSLVAAKVASFIFAYFSFRAIQFMVWATSLGGGDRPEELVRAGLSHLPIRSEFVGEMFNIFPGIDFGISLVPFASVGPPSAVSVVMAVMLFIVFASVIGYLLAIVAASQARAYVAIRYFKDGYKIDEEDSLFFSPEKPDQST